MLDLLAEALNLRREQLIAGSEQTVPDEAARRIERDLARRVMGEPLEYILGHTEFWGRRIEVSPAVLIPRPETELIVELALADASPPRSVVDVGTGSGALAITLAVELESRVVAIDASAEALEVAARNAARHRAPVSLLRGDGLAPFADRSFDLIVANPPYVDPGERDDLPIEVRDHEPAAALFSPGGLHHIRTWLAASGRVATSGARLLFEIGYSQAEHVREIVGQIDGLRLASIHADLQGIPRILDCRIS